MTTVSDIMYLADVMARKDKERDIPIGQLWRSITHDHYIEAREALRTAITDAFKAEYDRGRLFRL